MHLHDSMMMMTREQVSTSVISIIKAAYLLQGLVEWFQNWLGLQRIPQCTEVRFVIFLSCGFITAIVVNRPEMKQAKRTSVQCTEMCFTRFFSGGFNTMTVINLPERILAKRTLVQ